MQTMSDQPIVFVVDDDEAVRNAVQWMVKAQGLQSLGFESAESFLAAYRPESRGCLVLDVRMPGISGLELQDKLAELNIAIPVIIITGHADVPMAVHAMKHGALDFIQKPLSKQVLLDRIRHAIQLDADTRRQAHETREIGGRMADLTSREREVLDLILAGRLNKQIASALGLSSRTVEKHRAQLMAKMQANSTAELVLLAMKVRSSV
jgi:two-component system, LuxR family, response regulator FixJ